MLNFENMDKRLIIFGGFFSVSNRMQVLMDQNIKEITARQWYVLAILGLLGDTPSLIELARACDSSYQNVKRIVLKLEEKGFVRLEDDPDDKRAKCVVPTSKSRTWETSNSENAVELVNKMFSSFSVEQIEEFSKLILAVYHNLGGMKNEEEN